MLKDTFRDSTDNMSYSMRMKLDELSAYVNCVSCRVLSDDLKLFSIISQIEQFYRAQAVMSSPFNVFKSKKVGERTRTFTKELKRKQSELGVRNCTEISNPFTYKFAVSISRRHAHGRQPPL